jgi:glutathione S-transferase
MTSTVSIIGSYISPYVRKVLAVLHLKGVAYQIDPIVPFFGDDRFSEISPLRRIPVYSDGKVTLCDSTVICEYLEDLHPTPALYPREPADRARARWLEEFADTRMGEVIIWRLFNQVAINPRVFGVPTDEAVLNHARDVELPHVLAYLESQVPAQGFLFGEIGVADIAIAAFFRNAAFARYRVDAARWPRTAAFVERALAHDCLQRLVPFEKASMSVPPPDQRSALEAAGAPLSVQTLATNAPPRRGIMSI